MNFFRRRMLLKGTKHCWMWKAAKVCMMAVLTLAVVSVTLITANTGVIMAVEQTFNAQRNTRECLDVLSGNVRMLDPENGEVAEVTWIKLKPM